MKNVIDAKFKILFYKSTGFNKFCMLLKFQNKNKS